MPTLDPFNINSAVHSTPVATAPAQAPTAAPPAGPTGFWSRIQQVGIGKVNLMNAEKLAVRGGKDIGSFAKDTAVSAKNSAQEVVHAGVVNPIKLGAAEISHNKQARANVGADILKNNPKKVIGAGAQTALLGAPGGGKAAEVTGAALLKQFGTQGVKDLAEKVGVDIAGKASIESANLVAKNKLAQQAFKKASTTVEGRVFKSSVKTGAVTGAYGASQAASQNAPKKQIIKAGELGFAEGGLAGAAGSAVKSVVGAKFGKTPKVMPGTAPREGQVSPTSKIARTAENYKAVESKTAPPTTKMIESPKPKLLSAPSGKAEGKGFTMSPSADVAKVKVSARLQTINAKLNSVAQGKTSMASEDIKALRTEKANLESGVAPTKTTPLPSSLKSPEISTPVEKVGQGTSKSVKTPEGKAVSGSTLEAKARAIESGMVKDFPDEATFSQVSHKAEADKMAQQVQDNPQKVMDIATGKTPARNQSHLSAAWNATYLKAQTEGDGETMRALMAAPYRTKLSKGGQILGAEGYHGINGTDPIGHMEDVAATRTKAVEARMGTTVAQASSKIVKEEGARLDTHIKAPSKDIFKVFVESMKC